MTKEQEFIQLITQHKGILYKVSRLYMDQLDDQEDLTQEIIFQLWKAYNSFEGKSAFATWMYGVALNTALTFFKKESRKVDKEPLDKDMDHIEEEDSRQKDIQLDYFYNAVQELNPIEKALIFLFLEGMPHREIALSLGISEVNARVKLNRTKEKLQEIIKNNGYEF
ncbi:RNA polymerase sigma factor [Sphingobacterium olei]|uniref:RNA polymerase sigma factor n=1 Tax=Sphingobacterium olei TaxID=2571155 RepID=A0A4U0P2H0_9SPHI|nr:RNA polymerase sigma factor [Sphingobacterium olei]TJZ61497.1 RNA polymerase sigma factor [Sphingobacterium olei]